MGLWFFFCWLGIFLFISRCRIMVTSYLGQSLPPLARADFGFFFFFKCLVAWYWVILDFEWLVFWLFLTRGFFNLVLFQFSILVGRLLLLRDRKLVSSYKFLWLIMGSSLLTGVGGVLCPSKNCSRSKASHSCRSI